MSWSRRHGQKLKINRETVVRAPGPGRGCDQARDRYPQAAPPPRRRLEVKPQTADNIMLAFALLACAATGAGHVAGWC